MQSAAQPDEVVEVFSGDTLEEAMAYAVATLGPDLTVRRARRVRKGVQGLRGKERYEVVAVPAPRVSGDAVGNAFEALLQRAEQAEDPGHPAPVRRTTRPADAHTPAVVLESVPERAAEVELFDQELAVPLVPEPVTPTVPAPRAAEPAAAPATAPAPARAAARPRTAPRSPARPAARRAPRAVAAATPAPRRTTEGGWSRKALADLGLPRRVLAELPERDPRGDLAWLRALTRALAAVLPAPDPTAPVSVSGQGVEGVLGILAAARKGLTPGLITYGGRTAPATATELALAVRAELHP